ncbi:DUF4811 domain-containing protein [Dellaglioa algida]|uniref:DUF4811 domain-containing protein n=1 Tax=Dellaglioa algida DSM 15638 TaxID=1423719 RepID=A0A0R1HHH1_9LACO|nr:DUF4811 domain-containing protein [Dellaglioa algida]KRK45448.1 hypothetical protein FC66_GL001411 [Dellaglioa algida DSM 15638]MDK1733019.1 DUF4811 domain-containing protein [Dellaglioa algida]MDK1734533.1 DUF4811 domain-containing protein [Dellaglioa algida]
MIIILLVIAVVLFFLTWNLIRNNAVSYTLGGIFALCIIVLGGMIVVNYSTHYGMEKVTTTKTESLASMSKDTNLLVYQPIGTDGSEKVVVYKNTASQTKTKHTQTDDTTSKIVENAKSNKLVVKETRWVYKNNTYKLMFGIADNNHVLIKRTNTFYVKKDMLVLTANQAKAMPKIVKAEQAQVNSKAGKAKLAKEGATFAKEAVANAMMKNDKISSADKAEIVKQATDAFKVQEKAKVMQAILKEVKQVK